MRRARSLAALTVLAAVGVATPATADPVSVPVPGAPASPQLAIQVDLEDRDPQETARALGLVLARGIERANAAALPDAAPTQVTITGTSDAVTTVTTFSTNGASPTTAAAGTTASAARARVLRSHAPSLALAPAVLLGDILSLWAGDTPGSTLSLAPSPVRLVTFRVGSLTPLLGHTVEVLDAVWGQDGLTLATANGPIALDPLFRITPQTARDLARQSAGRQPVHSIRVPRTGTRIQLLADLRTVVLEDLRTGATDTVTAPGSPYGGLMAGPWGGFALWRTLAGQSMSDLAVGVSRDGLVRVRTHRVEGAFVTTASADADGNLWLFDVAERRIRVMDRWGREVHAIRPVVDRTQFALPRALEVYGDGSFLLAGEGAIWKLDPVGIPMWRLGELSPGRALPRSYRLALHGAGGRFSLLDTQTQEIHLFAESLVPANRAETELSRIGVDPSVGPAAAVWALDNDLVLIAGQLLGTQTDADHDAVVARRRLDEALSADLARATASWAALLEGALDLAAAEAAYAAAVDRYRALRDAYPTRMEYGRTLAALQDKRLSIRDTLQGHLVVDLTAADGTLHAMLGPLEAAVVLSVGPAGEGEHRVEGLVAELSAAEIVRPTQEALGDLVAGLEFQLPLNLLPDAALLEESRPVRVGIRLSGTVDGQVAGMTRTLDLTLSGRLRTPPGVPPARHLAWLAGTPDPAVRDTVDETLDLAGVAPTPDPLSAAALVYSLMADTFAIHPHTQESEVRSARQSLAARSGTWADALVLAASVLHDYGAAFLTVGDATYLAMDTGIPLAEVTGDARPTLERVAAAAGVDRVILPLAPPEDRGDPLHTAASRALRELRAAPGAAIYAAWVGSGPPVRAPHLWTPLLPRPDLEARAVLDALRTVALIRG